MIREELGKYMNEQLCPSCRGTRLRAEALAYRIGNWSIHGLVCQSIAQLLVELPMLPFASREWKIGEPILKEIVDRLAFLGNVGLGYLSLERRAGTLSGERPSAYGWHPRSARDWPVSCTYSMSRVSVSTSAITGN